MRRISKPTEPVASIYDICVDAVSKAGLKARLKACKPRIVHAANQFELRASASSLYTIRTVKKFANGLSAKEMIKVYTIRMARKGSVGRLYYDKVLASAHHGICPLCAQRTVSTVDHYLDKASYPQFVVTPVNLVPSCKDCNFIKNTFPKVTRSEEETLHPYYDAVEHEHWLFARVVEKARVPIEFFVTPSPLWSSIKAARVVHHFKSFDLAKLYSTHAAEELANIKPLLHKLFIAGGAGAVTNHLLQQAKSRQSVHLNSWQTSLYSAIASSPWFCSGGLNQI